MTKRSIYLAIGATLLSGTFAFAATNPTPLNPAAPKVWDQRIPIPKDAVLTTQTVPTRGVVHSATFTVPGDYDQLVDFYESGLKAQGFELGKPVKVPARKAYSVSFTKPGIQDNLILAPSSADPSKFLVRIAYGFGPEKMKHPHLARLRDWWSLWPHWWRDDSHVWKEGKEWIRRKREAAAERLRRHRGIEQPVGSPAPSPDART